MAQIVVDDVEWKKGETGVQKFIIFESDGITRRDGSTHSYVFSFWKSRGTVLKGTGGLVSTDAVQGEYDYTVVASDTNTIDDYVGEIIEDPVGDNLKSNTFKVDVAESSDFT